MRYAGCRTEIRFGLQDIDLGHLCELLFRRSSDTTGCPYFQFYYVKWTTGLYTSWLLDVGRMLAHWNLATFTRRELYELI